MPEKFLSKNGRGGDDVLFELELADPVENENKGELCEPAEEALNEPKGKEEKPNGAEKEEHPKAFAKPPPTDKEADVHGNKKTFAALLEDPETGAAVKLAESNDVSLSLTTFFLRLTKVVYPKSFATPPPTDTEGRLTEVVFFAFCKLTACNCTS